MLSFQKLNLTLTYEKCFFKNNIVHEKITFPFFQIAFSLNKKEIPLYIKNKNQSNSYYTMG